MDSSSGSLYLNLFDSEENTTKASTSEKHQRGCDFGAEDRMGLTIADIIIVKRYGKWKNEVLGGTVMCEIEIHQIFQESGESSSLFLIDCLLHSFAKLKLITLVHVSSLIFKIDPVR